MSYSVGEHFNKFIREQVVAGRYNNASEVVREGLRLVEEHETKLTILRNNISTVIDSNEGLSKPLNTDKTP